MKLEGKTNLELAEMSRQITEDPANQNPPGSFQLYTKKCRKILDRIDAKITSNLMDRRIALGLPINTDGYSGRQTNRRR